MILCDHVECMKNLRQVALTPAHIKALVSDETWLIVQLQYDDHPNDDACHVAIPRFWAVFRHVA